MERCKATNEELRDIFDKRISDEEKQQIDEMDYEVMLRLWRISPVGTPAFQGERGDYFLEAMRRKRVEVGIDAHVAASKRIGWE